MILRDIPHNERAAFIAKCQEMVDGGMSVRAVERHFGLGMTSLSRKVFPPSNLEPWFPSGRGIAAAQIARRLSVPGMPL